MGYGGYFPYPRRFGGGKPTLHVVHESLNAARGSALDASNSSTIVWVENMAYARAITFDGFGINERLANQWDPDRMTAFLGRWEKIFGIVPPPNSTEKERREKVKLRFQRFIDACAFHSRLRARLVQELGNFFVAIEYIDVNNAIVHVPDDTYPWGTMVDGYPWYSTVAHILVLLQKPTGANESEFYTAAGKVPMACDGLIPAWCTLDWYRAPATSVPITVSGGPSQAGFYLDNEHNLDNSVFDSYLPSDEVDVDSVTGLPVAGSELTGWWNARQESAGSLATFSDRSGNSKHFAQSVANERPTVVTSGINGQRAIYFDGTTRMTTTTGTVADFVDVNTVFTMFFVWRPVSVSTEESITRNNAPIVCDVGQGLIGVFLKAGTVTGTRTPTRVTGNHNDGSDDIVEVSCIHSEAHWGYLRFVGTTLYISIDGSPERSVTSATGSTPKTGALGIGYGFSAYFKGYLGEIIVYNYSCNGGQISRVGAYLRSAWRL